MAAMMERGVLVVEKACNAQICSQCLQELIENRGQLLSLPATMAEMNRDDAGQRCFLPFAVTKGKRAGEPPQHRRDFELGIDGHSVGAVLRSILSGHAGDCLAEALGGDDCQLCGLTAISCETGTAAQPIHADAEYSLDSARVITIFLAMHDVCEEAAGPTRFCPGTHSPACFPPEHVWLPPTPARVEERGGTQWFPLRAGDAVLMEATTWHGGGANTSGQWRTILSISFVASSESSVLDDGKWRLADFRAPLV